MTTENDGANAPPDVRAETPEGGGPEVSPFTLERARHDRRIAERDRDAAEDSARYWREMYERVRNNAETAMQRDHALMDERMELATKLSQAEKERDEAVAERDAARNEFLRLMRENAEFAKERDEARAAERAATETWKRLLGDEAAAQAEVEKLRSVLASRHGGEPEALLRELDAARAEVERLKNQHQTECEAMALELVAIEREECAKLAVRHWYPMLAAAIRARGGGK